MSVLIRIAYFQHRRDEVPNQTLAKELAETRNREGIQEIAENLQNKNKNIQSDCLKVLYEIGYIDPELIAAYVHDFLDLLKSKNNRMVWGAMIGLATIAEIKSRQIWEKVDDVIGAVDSGSLITIVWGIKTLATVASTDESYKEKIFPVLIGYLKNLPPRDIPLHAESILRAVDERNKQEFRSALEARQGEMTPPQLKRLKKILKGLEK